MAKYELQEKEMQTGKSRVVFGCEMTEYDEPIEPKENILLSLKGEPVWLPSTFDYGYLYPRCVPDNPAKGNVSDAKLSPEELGGKDMFGIEWEYVPQVGGSTVRPGNPLLEDANEWKEKVKFPTKEDIDSWDWESAKKSANTMMRDKDFWEIVICTGFYERLISFMDFEEAAVAMIDEDQQEAVKELYDKLADLYIMLIEKYLEVFGEDKIDAVCLHDDWGHQRGIFFSPDTLREMVVPYMKKVTDFIHSKGMIAECHSCGKVDALMPVYIEAGFQMLENQNILDFDTVVPEYGDRLIVHVSPDVPAPDAPEEEHIKAARAFVDKMIAYGKPFLMDNYYSPYLFTKTFSDEVYRYSREQLAK
jgi:hypothetical protein